MPIKAVLFDMFDTLMLIEKNHAFYIPSLKRAYKFLFKNHVKVRFEIFKDAYIKARNALYAEADPKLEEPHFNLRISKALENMGYVDLESSIIEGATNEFCEGFMEYVRIDEHAKSALMKLHQKYKLGIVSNFAIPECVTKLLEKHNLDKLFDVVVVSGAVNKKKPSSEVFQKALIEIGVRAENAVFVGDTREADILGAKTAGMKSIFVERRVQKEIENACPDQIIKDLSQLLEAIDNF
jgi:putative hydrolase of the HAD superfamily